MGDQRRPWGSIGKTIVEVISDMAAGRLGDDYLTILYCGARIIYQPGVYDLIAVKRETANRLPPGGRYVKSSVTTAISGLIRRDVLQPVWDIPLYGYSNYRDDHTFRQRVETRWVHRGRHQHASILHIPQDKPVRFVQKGAKFPIEGSN